MPSPSTRSTCSGADPLLYATTMGQPLYERLGFVVVEALVKHTALRTALHLPSPGRGVRQLQHDDVDAVSALDAEAYGVPRPAVLRAILAVASSAVVIETSDRITGYAIAWPGWDTTTVGPVVAASDEDAASLVAYLAALEPGHPLRVDVPHPRSHLRALLRSWGFVEVQTFPAMLLGARTLPGDRDRLFAISSLSLG